jgi:hypothetical protein
MKIIIKDLELKLGLLRNLGLFSNDCLKELEKYTDNIELKVKHGRKNNPNEYILDIPPELVDKILLKEGINIDNTHNLENGLSSNSSKNTIELLEKEEVNYNSTDLQQLEFSFEDAFVTEEDNEPQLPDEDIKKPINIFDT